MNFFKVKDGNFNRVYLNLDKVESIDPDFDKEEPCIRFLCQNGNTYFYFGTWDEFSREYPDVWGDTHFSNQVNI